MNRREFIKFTTAGVAAAATTSPPPLAFPMAQPHTNKVGSKPPNIILIMADDMGYGNLGCYGNNTIKTPNIDTLAKAGMKFTDFHSNSAVCSPTRAALLTGRYQQRCGIEGVIYAKGKTCQTGLALEEITFAEVLKTAGYDTARLQIVTELQAELADREKEISASVELRA